MECTKCGEDKDVKLFGNDSRHHNGKKSACKVCENGQYRKRYDVDPNRALWNNRKYRYGIAKLDFYSMKLKQFGLCAVCRDKLPLDNKIHVDHCHKTGRIRGLLCCRCNTVIGHIENHPGIIGNLVDYLE